MAYSLLRPELLSEVAPLLAGFLACTAVTLFAGQWMMRRLPGVALLRRLDQLGTSEMEFTLAFPFFLMMVLTTIQMALLINGTLIVDYAAFCAARSAIVWIPQDTPGESANTVANPEQNSSEKWTRIRRAATLACVPISPRASSFLGFRLPIGAGAIDAGGIGDVAQAGGGSDNGVNYARLSLDVIDKWPYASLYTDVALLGADGNARTQFAAGSPVTARVTYRFYMNVPFGGSALGAALGRRFLGVLGPYYVPVTASYTLMMTQG